MRAVILTMSILATSLAAAGTAAQAQQNDLAKYCRPTSSGCAPPCSRARRGDAVPEGAQQGNVGRLRPGAAEDEELSAFQRPSPQGWNYRARAGFCRQHLDTSQERGISWSHPSAGAAFWQPSRRRHSCRAPPPAPPRLSWSRPRSTRKARCSANHRAGAGTCRHSVTRAASARPHQDRAHRAAGGEIDLYPELYRQCRLLLRHGGRPAVEERHRRL